MASRESAREARASATGFTPSMLVGEGKAYLLRGSYVAEWLAMKRIAIERGVWLALLLAIAGLTRFHYSAQIDAWKMAATRSQLNPAMLMHTENSPQGMRQVADLPCGEHFVVWTLQQ